MAKETVYSDGCPFCPAGVVCAAGPSETRCGRCGWNPRIAEARKEQAREKLRRGAFAPPKVPIEMRFDALRRDVLREYYLTHRGMKYCGRGEAAAGGETPIGPAGAAKPGTSHASRASGFPPEGEAKRK